jgi:hypothetical protein
MPEPHKYTTWSEMRNDFLSNPEVAAAYEELSRELDSMDSEIPEHATCAICRWYTGAYDDGDIGHCRRYAPDPSWPVVRHSYVCGDWTTDYSPVTR